jgi:hypothetical protein
MPRFARLLSLPLLALAVGCSNRPLASTLDCFFPSKAQRRPEPPPDGLIRPTDNDPLPPPNFDPNPRTPPRDNGLPRIGDPVAPDGTRPRSDEVPWTREPAPGAMPLPGGGRN